MRNILIITAILLLTTSCGPKKIPETESNNSFTKAQLLVPEITVNGGFYSSEDEDIYLVEIRELCLLSIVISASREIDPALTVYNTDRTIRKLINDHSDKHYEEIRNLFLPAGRYYIKAENVNDLLPRTNSYRLHLRLQDLQQTEGEPNDKLRDAFPFPQNSTIKGYYSPALNPLNDNGSWKENDYYKIEFSDEGDYMVRLDLSANDTADPAIELIDYKGDVLLTVDNHGPGKGEHIRNLSLKAPTDLYINIYTHTRTDLNSAYEIINEVLPQDNSLEGEVNDSMYTASPFPAESDEIRGLITSSNDQDFFVIPVNFAEGKLLNVVLHPPEDLELKLELMDNIGSRIAHSTQPGPGSIQTIANILVYQNDFYLKVSCPQSNWNENEEYIIRKFFRETIPGLEEEPNDDENSATRIETGKLYTGFLSHQGDYDFYEFNIYFPGDYRIELTPIKGSVYTITLINQRDKIVGGHVVNSEDGISMMSEELRKGTYRLRISPDLGNSKIQENEPYRFKIIQE